MSFGSRFLILGLLQSSDISFLTEKKANKRHTNKSQGEVEKITKKGYCFRAPFKNIRMFLR